MNSSFSLSTLCKFLALASAWMLFMGTDGCSSSENEKRASYEQGRQFGYKQGRADGWNAGVAYGVQQGEMTGKQAGKILGEQLGYERGFSEGEKEGNRKGYFEGSKAFAKNSFIPTLGLVITTLLVFFLFGLLKFLFGRYAVAIKNRYRISRIGYLNISEFIKLKPTDIEQKKTFFIASKNMLEEAAVWAEKLRRTEIEHLTSKKKELLRVEEILMEKNSAKKFVHHWEDLMKAQELIKRVKANIVSEHNWERLQLANRFIEIIKDDPNIPTSIKLEILQQTIFKS